MLCIIHVLCICPLMQTDMDAERGIGNRERQKLIKRKIQKTLDGSHGNNIYILILHAITMFIDGSLFNG